MSSFVRFLAVGRHTTNQQSAVSTPPPFFPTIPRLRSFLYIPLGIKGFYLYIIYTGFISLTLCKLRSQPPSPSPTHCSIPCQLR